MPTLNRALSLLAAAVFLFACGLLPTPEPTATATPPPTETPVPTATATASATPRPSATLHPIERVLFEGGTPASRWFFIPVMPEARQGINEGREYYFYVVEDLQPEDVFAFYEQELPPLGWTLLDTRENEQGLPTHIFQGPLGLLVVDVIIITDVVLVVVLGQPTL